MTIRRGILKSFNSMTYRADIQVDGSLNTRITGVPTSRAIASGDMTAGRFVALLALDEANPDDAVVIAVWT
ncbi:MAG TPA: hypothetical protein VNN10_07970 [Dehalococcoidia bacterium]|nr:hypothetical protein [Dehalococcoidia bacterium]